MAEEIRHPDGRIEHPAVRFEPSDASFRGIIAILAGTIASLAVLHVAVFWFFAGYRDHLADINRSHYPLAPRPSATLPQRPRLEQIDRLAGVKDTSVYVREEAKLGTLNSYGPTETKEFVHIPIERAMQHLVQKKMLSARPEPSLEEQRRAGGLIDAGASNSGRLFKGGKK